jgi:outer membrane protein
MSAAIMTFYEAGWGALDLHVSSDVSNKHDGTTGFLSYSYPLNYKNWELSPYLSAQWVSSEITQYYAGVSEVDARRGKPADTSKSGRNFGFGIRGEYSINNKDSVLVDLKGPCIQMN